MFVSFLLTGPCQTSGARYLAPWRSLSTVRQPYLYAASGPCAPLVPAHGAQLEVLTQAPLGWHGLGLGHISREAGLSALRALVTFLLLTC